MKTTLTVLTVATLAGGVALGAEITGKIKLTGTPPPEKKITLDAMCGKLAPAAGLTTRHYLTSPDKGLANVFVYVKEGAKPAPPTAPAPLLDQVGCEYTPYMLGVQAGQSFNVKNSDSVLHNVHAIPRPGSGNKEKNIGQPVKGMVSPFMFEKPEVLVKFKCDVHPWMSAFVVLADAGRGAVTGVDGRFALDDVPPGTYAVDVWHERFGTKSQQITVEPGAAAQVRFEYAPADR
jgi:hypothetical protein